MFHHLRFTRIKPVSLALLVSLIFWVLASSHAYGDTSAWTWQYPVPERIFFSLDFIDANTGWAVGESETILKTVDGGTTWIACPGHELLTVNSHLQSVDFIDANTGWAVGGPDWGWPDIPESTILKTVDGGTTWTRISSGLYGGLDSVDFIDPLDGWAVGYNGTIAKTEDGGTTWTRQESGTTNRLNSICFIDRTTGWAVGYNGTLLKTTDGGATWILQPSGTTNVLNSVAFVDMNTGWAVGNYGTVLRTIDGGANWIGVASGTTDWLNSVCYVDTSTVWAAGSTQLGQSLNGGATWAWVSSGKQVIDMCFINANKGWAAGYHTLGKFAEGNTAPVLGAVGDKSVNEGSLLSFTAAASDVDLPVQALSFTLDKDAPTGSSIDPTTGAFTWTPSEAQGPGTYPITIIVSDGVTTDSETIMVTVNEVNTAPVLGAVGDKSVNEGSLLSFTAAATDTDVPANTLTFSLSPGAPTGAAITSGGAFTWTPSEAQGPGTYTIIVRVSDGKGSIDSETIMVTVNEVNTAPVLGAVGDKSVNEGSLLSFTAAASDVDLPVQALSFTLDKDAPTGSSIDPTTGAFTWTPSEAQGPGTYPITIIVSDGVTTDSETVVVTVAEMADPPAPATLIPIYRFYNVKNGSHFYTASAVERDTVIARWPNIYTYENVAYMVNTANPANSSPLFRFYNKKNGSHFYTVSEQERGIVRSRWPDVYEYEGPVYNVCATPVTGATPVYRFYNKKNGSHFYTVSEQERDMVISKWSDVYTYEGPAFWLGQ